MAGLVVAAMGTLATAHSDIEIEVEDNRIVTEYRVYGAELGEFGSLNGAEGTDPAILELLPEAPYMTNEPGFDAEPGTFPTSRNITLTLTDDLKAWDGSGFVPTGSLGSATEYMQVQFFTANAYSNDPLNNTITIPVQPDGGWHKHLVFLLFPNSGSPLADIGVYALEMELSINDVSIAPSERFWLVFNYGDSDMNHDNAIAFLESAAIPEPASVAVLMAGSLALLRRRR